MIDRDVGSPSKIITHAHRHDIGHALTGLASYCYPATSLRRDIVFNQYSVGYFDSGERSGSFKSSLRHGQVDIMSGHRRICKQQVVG